MMMAVRFATWSVRGGGTGGYPFSNWPNYLSTKGNDECRPINVRNACLRLRFDDEAAGSCARGDYYSCCLKVATKRVAQGVCVCGQEQK